MVSGYAAGLRNFRRGADILQTPSTETILRSVGNFRRLDREQVESPREVPARLAVAADQAVRRLHDRSRPTDTRFSGHRSVKPPDSPHPAGASVDLTPAETPTQPADPPSTTPLGALAETETSAADVDLSAWETCRRTLKAELTDSDYVTWIRPLCCHRRGNRLLLGAPNRYVREWLLQGTFARMQELLAAEEGDLEVSLHVGTSEAVARIARESSPPQRQGTRGRTSEAVVERAQLDLFELERSGQFTAVSIHPQNEFPTLLTRIPIFVPGRARRQRARLDQDHSLPFRTSWGTGRKFGPPLTVYDEDTLMALGRLRHNMLIGNPAKMPYPVSKLYASDEEPDVHVHVVLCMLSDIQAMCGTSVGGRNNKLRLQSVRRLAATKIELNKETRDKVRFAGTTIDLVHVRWDVYEDNAVLYVQFSPIMAQWLERAYTYVDWNVRRGLRTDVGKSVHRFLSGQPRKYQIFTRKLQATIGHDGPYKYFMADLREALQQLQDADWIRDCAILGNGRKQPHKLVVDRSQVAEAVL
ncbi:MAG: hypothetical protein F4X36_04060 [Gammaproteobacteria bacterium]|nr:hypothetical protein [Gammaproteobacteria bacterium]